MPLPKPAASGLTCRRVRSAALERLCHRRVDLVLKHALSPFIAADVLRQRRGLYVATHFLDNELVQDGVIRQLEIVGDAVKSVSARGRSGASGGSRPG